MHVLVIGGGLGGLTCARELAQRGIDVTVVEASDGVGGRVRTDRVQGYTLDRGFQVLFDAYPAAQRQLDLAALDLHEFDPGAIICVDGRRVVLTDPLRDTNLLDRVSAAATLAISPFDKLRTLALALELRGQTIDEMLEGGDTTSIAFLRQRGFSDQMIDLFFRPFYGGILFDRELQTSAKCLKFDFKMLSESMASVPRLGMDAISEQLAAPIRQHIRLNTKAESLLGDAEHVSGAVLAGGEHVDADAVVLATPAPEAARLGQLAAPIGVKQTVTLYFSGDTPFYKGKKLLLNAAPDALVNNAQLVSNVNPAYAPAGKHLLSAVLIGIPAGDDHALFKAALRDMQKMFQGDTKAQAALASYQPLAAYRISYAQFDQPPGIHPTLPDNRATRRNLYLAGEFTEASSLNAAMISGEKCAAAILDDMP